MSKIKAALVTMFVLGTSSAAMAAPSVTFSAQARASISFGTRTPTTTDHRSDAFLRQPVPVRQPVPLPVRPVRIPVSVNVPQVRDHRFEERPDAFAQGQSYNDGYGSDDDGYNDTRTSWMLLGTVNRIVDTGTPMQFNLGREAGRVNKIMLQSNGGKTRVAQVTINFADGRSETIKLDRYLGSVGANATVASSANITIDVQRNRRIASITVEGQNARESSFSVYAL